MRPQQKSSLNGFSTAGSDPSFKTGSLPKQPAEPGAELSTEFSSMFGTTAAGTGTDAVSQIFAAGGFQTKRRRLQIAGAFAVLAMVAMLGVWMISNTAGLPQGPVNDPTTTAQPQDVAALDPVEPVDEFELTDDIETESLLDVVQTDLNMDCEVLSESPKDNLVRYGCNAVLKSGDYYGVVLGWWQAVDTIGKRVPITDLSFRNEGFDTTFGVRVKQSMAKIKLIPWVR